MRSPSKASPCLTPKSSVCPAQYRHSAAQGDCRSRRAYCIFRALLCWLFRFRERRTVAGCGHDDVVHALVAFPQIAQLCGKQRSGQTVVSGIGGFYDANLHENPPSLCTCVHSAHCTMCLPRKKSKGGSHISVLAVYIRQYTGIGMKNDKNKRCAPKDNMCFASAVLWGSGIIKKDRFGTLSV